MLRTGLFCFVFILLQACSHSRYQQNIDSTPKYKKAIVHLKETKPVREMMSRRGNTEKYEVWGETYKVDIGLTKYSQVGIASWYGQKFHGHETSNGEIFDVYQFSAAHKSLPLPSIVRVTNLENKKSLIVRVNDRGPFHGNRLIDLSYAAAHRLGFLDKGTASVRVDLLAAPLMPSDYMYLQVAAFRIKKSAQFLQKKLSKQIKEPVYINKVGDAKKVLYKVCIGPLTSLSVDKVQTTLKQLKMLPALLLPI